MSDAILVDEEEVRQGAIDTFNTKSELDGALQSLRNLVDDLAAAWTGAGGTALQNVMVAFDSNAASMLEALEQLGMNMDASAVEQAAADAEEAASIGTYEGEL